MKIDAVKAVLRLRACISTCFSPIWVLFGTGNENNGYPSNCGFHENRHSESHALRMSVNEFLSALSKFIVSIRVKFDFGHLPITLLNFCEFRGDRLRTVVLAL